MRIMESWKGLANAKKDDISVRDGYDDGREGHFSSVLAKMVGGDLSDG